MSDERKNTEPKQVIVIRKDLNMPPGKLAAQVAHASMGALFTLGSKTISSLKTRLEFDLEKDSAPQEWIDNSFTKIVLYVKSEEKLFKVAEKAKEAGLPTALIKDSGFTVFDQPTNTCVGIGPAFPDDFVGITDKLRVF